MVDDVDLDPSRVGERAVSRVRPGAKQTGTSGASFFVMAASGSLTGELEVLYRERYRHFLRVATAIVGDEPSGHDAVQDGFAQALRQQRSFRGDGPLEAWVWRIVVNAALANRRGGGPRAEVAESEELASQNGGAADDAGVRAWVGALPERQRLAVYLRYYADLDYRSIAHALGVEVGTVSATLSSAHQALRRSLQEVER
ncbi:MAG TPA: RNA polymerase sigma factor [Gaiellaceae bacterium]|nr:RNA polymerase sigma factor [Gaiellaceae bacterium]